MKNEIAHETGAAAADRGLSAAFGHPAGSRFFERTLGEDGDPLGALLPNERLFSGAHVTVHPVGGPVPDESGTGDEVITVLAGTPRRARSDDASDTSSRAGG